MNQGQALDKKPVLIGQILTVQLNICILDQRVNLQQVIVAPHIYITVIKHAQIALSYCELQKLAITR